MGGGKKSCETSYSFLKCVAAKQCVRQVKSPLYHLQLSHIPFGVLGPYNCTPNEEIVIMNIFLQIFLSVFLFW